MFFAPNDEKITDDCFFRIMLTSVLGIVICVICLSGLTWAWFSCSITSSLNSISAADFSVKINVEKVTDDNATILNSGDIESSEDPNGTFNYSLPVGSYTVTIEAGGTASTGYCTVEFKGKTYHTIQLYPGSSEEGKPGKVTFTLVADAEPESELKITPQWGSYLSPNETLIGDNCYLGNEGISDTELQLTLGKLGEEQSNETEEQTYVLTDSEQAYTVQEGDTLLSIAELYGTTEEILAAYNEIDVTNPEAVMVGNTIKIPPAGYTIPKTSDSQTSDTEAGSIESETSSTEQNQNEPVSGGDTGSDTQDPKQADTSSTTHTDKPFITDMDTQSTTNTESTSAKNSFVEQAMDEKTNNQQNAEMPME